MQVVEIDGSFMEGGGQIVRSSIALSCLTGKGVRIKNIRKGRKIPGLKMQHYKSIKFLEDVCDAKTEGVKVGSEEIVFIPGRFSVKDKYDIDLETAGSITLFLQAVMPVFMKLNKEVELRIKGGSDVKWSPSSDHYRYVFIENLRKLGYLSEYNVLRRGFYPKGRGEVYFKFNGFNISDFDFDILMEKRKVKDVEVKVVISKSLEGKGIFERIKKGFLDEVRGVKEEVKFSVEYVESLSEGVVANLIVKTEKWNYGRDVLGERGLRAEVIGKRLGKSLKDYLTSDYVLDEFTTDQILVYLAYIKWLKKDKRKVLLRAEKVSTHTLTNIEIIRKFVEFEVWFV